MAFEEFGALSRRRREEDAEKLKKNIVWIIVGFVIVFLIIGGGILAYINYTHQNESNEHSGPRSSRGSKSDEIVSDLCKPTDHKIKCEDTISKVVKTGSVEPKNIVMATISAASAEFTVAVEQIKSFKFDNPNDKAAYDDCKTLFDDALEELQLSLSKSDNYSSKCIDDLRTLLSAVVSYQETCIDGFPENSDMKKKMRIELNATKGYLSNSLAIVTKMPDLVSKLSRRALLDYNDDKYNDVIPHWIGRIERDLVQKSFDKLVANVTVAKDGSGNFKSINEALAGLPKTRKGRFYIHIKEGTYNEHVIVTKDMSHITMYGDGSQKSIVTGSKNYVDKVTTFQTSTFAKMNAATIGEGFIAISMGFKNTAGPEKHEAVALRVQADKSIFLNCSMEGYQYTLYAQTHRQFYRGCVIMGTVDFIFGDATAIFQNCTIQVRKPMETQQNTITAQGRTCRYENTGFVLQRCRIIPDKDLKQDQTKFKTYLGRPRKDFSRTVVMESTLENMINPEGWLKWSDNTTLPERLKKLYYAEFNNKGPGANVKSRVRWPGYIKSLTKKQASDFTVTPFLRGSWIKDVGVPVQLGLYNS